MTYNIYLIPNGSLRNLYNRRFIDSNCSLWGVFDSVDDAKSRIKEMAFENAISETIAMDIDEAEKFAEFSANNCGFEWGNDLKWVKVVLMNDDEEIVEILG